MKNPIDLEALQKIISEERDVDNLLEWWLKYEPRTTLTETIEQFEERKALVVPLLIAEKQRRINAEEEIF